MGAFHAIGGSALTGLQADVRSADAVKCCSQARPVDPDKISCAIERRRKRLLTLWRQKMAIPESEGQDGADGAENGCPARAAHRGPGVVTPQHRAAARRH